MNREKLAELCKKYNLTHEDTYNHKHYLIITRTGIDKIQAIERINIDYDVIRCERDFAAVKAIAEKKGKKIQTFGSALYGEKIRVQKQGSSDYKWKDTGTTQSHYVLEMAEKRAMSRAVLKLTGFYELGAFGEDESEDFKQTNTPTVDAPETPPVYNRSKLRDHQVKDLIAWAINKNATIKIIKHYYILTEAQEKAIKEGLVDSFSIDQTSNMHEHTNN